MRQVEQMMENELFYQHVVEEIFGDSLPSDGCGEMLLVSRGGVPDGWH